MGELREGGTPGVIYEQEMAASLQLCLGAATSWKLYETSRWAFITPAVKYCFCLNTLMKNEKSTQNRILSTSNNRAHLPLCPLKLPSLRIC